MADTKDPKAGQDKPPADPKATQPSQPIPPGQQNQPAQTPDGHLNTRNPENVASRMAPPPARPEAVHEAVQKGGEVPLPEGHPRNPPGSIPRSPGEWPSGHYPPEHPRGPQPAEIADKETATRTENEAKAISEDEKKKSGQSSGQDRTGQSETHPSATRPEDRVTGGENAKAQPPKK